MQQASEKELECIRQYWPNYTQNISINDTRNLVKTLVSGAKSIIWGMVSYAFGSI